MLIDIGILKKAQRMPKTEVSYILIICEVAEIYENDTGGSYHS